MTSQMYSTVIYHKVSSINDSKILQKDIDNLESWGDKWGLNFILVSVMPFAWVLILIRRFKAIPISWLTLHFKLSWWLQIWGLRLTID